ncbi:MAG: DNA glycosylase [Oscillospiraceae bacterium]|nr:DNA glycosylase [Oscillospiraceae bacterium]
MRMIEQNEIFLLQGVSYFDLARTLDCGQCFRWRLCDDGFWEGVAAGRFCRVRQRRSVLLFTDTDRQSIRDFWIPYFSLDVDYAALCRDFRSDPVLAQAMDFAPGIRLLRQEPWETLCSFIISQNNHIPRIRGIIERLCALLGEPLPGGMSSFPSPEQLARCTLEDLAPLRSGFRAKYLLDAAQKVLCGAVDLRAIGQMDPDAAREKLTGICGVGPKVADCVLLYAYNRTQVVPMDVWMKRVLAVLYPDGFPKHFSPYWGIAQQFLFHYARSHAGLLRAPL